jgi:biopolymer transport protein ExbB
MTIISSLVSLGTLVGFGTVGMIKAFGALAAAELLIKRLLQLLILQQVLDFSSNLSYNFFTSKIDDLTYSIDEAVFDCKYTEDSEEV